MKTKESNKQAGLPPSPSSVLFGEEDVTRLAASWLETHLNSTEGDKTVNWKTEIRAASNEMRAALKRAGMYSPNTEVSDAGTLTQPLKPNREPGIR